jgi:mannose-1-phosphate guanylyltransferase
MAEASTPLILPVILSGGAGTRLWPLSRAKRPKQMLALTGAETMLAMTARRVADPALYAAPVVVAPAEQAEAVEAEVAAAATLILEPCARNTGPAIALAALNAAPEDVLLVLPSDHLIKDVDAFGAAVRKGLPLAAAGWIVTFGMAPDRAETGYGYIKRGQSLADGVFAAERFVEKPDAGTAARFIEQGGHDWNAGIFLMRADALIDGLDRHAPAILAAARAAVAGQTRQGRRVRPDPAAFGEAPARSIDHALMERAERVAVVPAAVGWSDIGSWAALHAAGGGDENGNVVEGPVIALDASGCLIRSEGPLVAAIGVEDLVIVATGDAVLVVPRAQSQRVREAVERLGTEGYGRWI